MTGTLQKRHGAFLPHWTIKNGIYAICFRLADSIPQMQLRLWQQERRDILDAAQTGKRDLTPQERLHLVQLNSMSIERYLRCGYGDCWLQRETIATIVIDALKYFEGERYRLFAWCVMPNHVHVVAQPFPGQTLSAILQSWKGFTAREANKTLRRTGMFWQREYFDRWIRTADELQHHIAYTWENPALAGHAAWRWRWKMEEESVRTFIRSHPDSPWSGLEARETAR
ncbi:MAG: transposase [Candidatus Peribacteraceae bacterium]|nr:transposase [Candidatus Peribacteraceae bacterium]